MHKIVDNVWSGICGVFGFGVTWTSIHWGEILPKIFVASMSAALAGGMGYIGKSVTVLIIRKIKLFINRLKIKNGNNNHL